MYSDLFWAEAIVPFLAALETLKQQQQGQGQENRLQPGMGKQQHLLKLSLSVDNPTQQAQVRC